MSCIACVAFFRDTLDVVGGGGVDDLDEVPPATDAGSDGEHDVLKFWAVISTTTVGDCDGEASSSSLSSCSDLTWGSMGVAVVMARESEEVAVKASWAMGGADRSTTLLLLRLTLRDALWLLAGLSLEYMSVMTVW